MVRLTQIRWNGTVSQRSNTNIATRFAMAKITQAMSTQTKRRDGHVERSARINPIPHSTNGLDQLAAKLGPQTADVDVDDVGARIEVISPHVGQNAFLGQRLTSAPHELTE